MSPGECTYLAEFVRQPVPVFATIDAAHEDEARALDVSRDLFAALEALRDSGLDSDEAKAKARAAIHKARGVL